MLISLEVDLIQQIFDQLVPENIVVFIIAKEFESEVDQVEPIYSTRFSTKKIEEATLQVC